MGIGLRIPTGLDTYAKSHQESEEKLLRFTRYAESLCDALEQLRDSLNVVDECTQRPEERNQSRWGSVRLMFNCRLDQFKCDRDGFKHEDLLHDIQIIELANAPNLNLISVGPETALSHSDALRHLSDYVLQEAWQLKVLLQGSPHLKHMDNTATREFRTRSRIMHGVYGQFDQKHLANIWPEIRREIIQARNYMQNHLLQSSLKLPPSEAATSSQTPPRRNHWEQINPAGAEPPETPFPTLLNEALKQISRPLHKHITEYLWKSHRDVTVAELQRIWTSWTQKQHAPPTEDSVISELKRWRTAFGAAVAASICDAEISVKRKTVRIIWHDENQRSIGEQI